MIKPRYVGRSVVADDLCASVEMVLCHPDLTLEPFDPLERDFEVERVGATHVCRDWTAVLENLDRNWDEWVNGTSGSSEERYAM